MQKTSFKIPGSSLLPSYLRFFDKTLTKTDQKLAGLVTYFTPQASQLNYQKLTFYKIVTAQSGFGVFF